MKKLSVIVIVIVTVVYAFSCGKTTPGYISPCVDKPAVSDSGQLLAFAKANGIAPTADSSWMYYQVINPGTGASPSATSKVYVRYSGTLMNGALFDSSAGIRLPLDSLIKGWQYGLPKIKAGGQIKLLIPSILAYGCNGAGSAVPSNAPVYFNIYLDSLK